MIRSMTGFAEQSLSLILADSSTVHATISIKSLNSRFFETMFRLPHPLSNLETDLVKRLKKELHRGSVHFTIYVGDLSAFKGAVAPALMTVTSYVHAIEEIKKHSNLSGSIDLKDIITLPNVFVLQEQRLAEQSIALILKTTDTLIQKLIADQAREGALLAQDLLERIALAKQEMATIAVRAEQLMEEKKQQVMAEIQGLGADDSKAADTHKSILYVALDKIDIHEEIARFKNHLDNLEQQLVDKKTVENGKRIDFILQELAREINTIAAKCSDSDISMRAINIKVELEKAREQTQNIV